MKKRVLSMFMALALCLTLLPAPAWAAEADAPESGAAQIGETVYPTLPDAVNAAQDGDTIKLLSDVELSNEVGEKGLSVSEGSFTLDLNNKTLKGAIWKQLLEVSGTANITIKNGSLVNTMTGYAGGSSATELVALKISGGTVALDKVNLTSGINSEGKHSSALYITGGSLTVTGSTFTGEVGVFCENSGTRPALSIADATLNNGILYMVAGAQASDTAGLEAIFAAGSMLFGQDGKYIDLARKEYWHIDIENVGAIFLYTEGCIVKPHTHKVVNGACECGATFAASVTQNGAVAYYKDFHTALDAAKAGDTLTLLADVQGDVTVTIDKAITFDLNGHRIYDLTVRCKITLKDSAGGTGKIAEWLRVQNGLTIGDLLEEGYALRNAETGAWYGETEQTVGNVTVQQVPITSVTLTALNADGTDASTSIPYGTTGGIKLSASCTRQGAGELSCQWYTIGGMALPIEGATEPVYQLPADLSVGEHGYLVTATADGYSKSADITITVEKIDLANATVTIDPWHADGKFRFYPYASETAALSFLSEVTVTANGEKYPLNSDDYTYEGATATRVGKYTLTIKATDSCAKFKGSKAIPWEVIPHQLYRPVFQGSQTYTKTYDGTTTLPGSYTWLADFYGKEGTDQNVTLKSGDYEVTAAGFVSADAGENKPINQTVTLKNENFVFSPTEIVNVKGITTTDKTLTYTNFTPTEAYPTGGTTFKIEKATMPDFEKEVTLDIVNNHADTYAVDLSALLPKLESPRTYGEIEYSQPTVQLASGYYTDGNAKVENGKLILTIDKNPVTTTGSIGTVTVQVTTTNYKPVTLTVNLRSVNKRKLGMFVFVATDPIVYGMTLGDIKLSAEATVDKQVIPGTIAWEDPLTTVPAAGRATYRWTFTPDDTMHYLTASNTINFLVDKATPTGAPTYTAITTGGKTLADAPLTPNASWPSGTVQWVDKDGKPLPASTQVQANTKYTWSFTPADAANYNGATGSVTLYAVSSGGGGGGGSSSGSTVKTDTVTNPDGSVTKTETKSDGTVIATTTAKDDSVTRIETKPDGSSVTQRTLADGSTGTVKTDKHGQTTAETTLSSKAIEDAKRNGEAVKAPVEVKASRDSNTAPTVKVELPKGAGETKVEIPVSNVKPGTVAVIVHPDGTEEIVKNSLPTEDGIQLTVNGGATVKIVDNSKDFIDTRNHWAKDAIDFVSARGLVNGMSGTTYAPDASTTRAQLWTILARQNDADLNGGNTWYEKAQLWSKNKGVSDGANPNGTIDRAQMVTMLWRAAGQPTAGGTANFTDVPADSYYANAVSWAVEGGITTGIGGGRFDPNSTCTRAQIATFLYRSYQSK